MALTKANMVERLLNTLNLDTLQAKTVVDAFFEEMRVTLERGEPVKFTSFGQFELRDKAARPGRNPKTGEAVSVSARRVVIFRPSHALKARVMQVQASVLIERLGKGRAFD